MIWNAGDGSDLFEGGDGNDTAEVNGGNGAEIFTITANGSRVRFDRVSPAPFTLDIGTTENLVLHANGGDDVITAGNGLASLISLTLDGGAGNDTLLGGDGNDTIQGGRGSDTANLGAGDNIFSCEIRATAATASTAGTGGVKVTTGSSTCSATAISQRRSMPRGRATRPRQQSVSACRPAS